MLVVRSGWVFRGVFGFGFGLLVSDIGYRPSLRFSKLATPMIHYPVFLMFNAQCAAAKTVKEGTAPSS